MKIIVIGWASKPCRRGHKLDLNFDFRCSHSIDQPRDLDEVCLMPVYWFQIMIITLIMSVVNWSLWPYSIDSLLVIRVVTRVIMTSRAI